MSKSRCLGIPWHALAYLIHPPNLFKHFKHVCIESLSPSCPLYCHPNNAHIANTSCFKKADTRTSCRYALLRQPPICAFGPRGPYLSGCATSLLKRKNLARHSIRVAVASMAALLLLCQWRRKRRYHPLQIRSCPATVHPSLSAFPVRAPRLSISKTKSVTSRAHASRDQITRRMLRKPRHRRIGRFVPGSSMALAAIVSPASKV